MSQPINLLRSLVKAAVARTPYRVVRASAGNRFNSIEDVCIALAKRGYNPKRIIDAGANIGLFARMVADIFPEAIIELIEPQPACKPVLSAIVASNNRYKLHPFAIGAESGELDLAIGDGEITTGAFIIQGAADNKKSKKARVPVTTLDMLIPDDVAIEARTFLKLDLQGFELMALRGAKATLPRIEVVLTEASFFAQSYEPSIETLVRFFDESGFSLYDIASLYARPRDDRPHQTDLVFVRNDSQLLYDKSWE